MTHPAPASTPNSTPSSTLRRLALTEAWERFSLHGVKALLTLYLLTVVLPGGVERVVGLATLRRAIEGTTGTGGDLAFASQVYGLYGALTYLALPFGGMLADRLRSRRAIIVAGGVLMTAGHLCLIYPAALLAGLALLIVGTGCLKGNLAAAVGAAHPPGDSRRDRAFLVYLGFLNVGAMLGPLVCGLIAARLGFSYAFGAVAAGMIVALAIFRTVPATPAGMADPAPAGGRPGLARAWLAVVSVTLCFSAYEQLTNIFLVWADAHVDLHVGGFAVPPAWFAAADGLFTILLVVAGALGWPRLAHRGWEPPATAKLALGCVAVATGYALTALLALSDARLGLAGPVVVVLLLDIGIVLAWPAALALITAAAPRGRGGMMVGIFYLHGFVAHLVVGRLGAAYATMPASRFWLIHVGIATAGALVALPLLRRQATTSSIPASALR
ncbi:MFS transporter [Sphingomonas sp. UBA978]|uniref:POT-type proton-dependent oligopeptide transporter n=1 Tax=Sphingomonas sp. UBA978 TaxID=1947536 RepID=UPI0025F5F086|nr:MFS transporter [Sphingomonas sp. UBA978]